LGESENNTPRLRICNNEATELISSIKKSPMKKEKGIPTLDKSSEKMAYHLQAENSTQIATALMYLVYGLYNKFLPSHYR
jgi:hypothetical protein